VATRVRALLASAQPLVPAHLAAGEAATEIKADLAELRERLATRASTLAGRGRPLF
jgi:hypothetical protein